MDAEQFKQFQQFQELMKKQKQTEVRLALYKDKFENKIGLDFKPEQFLLTQGEARS